MGKYKWYERTETKICRCNKKFKSFQSARRKYCSFECYKKYKEKRSPWNLGKKASEETRKKMSNIRKKLWSEGKMSHRRKLIGDLNHSKTPEVKDKIRKTHEKNGLWTPLNQLNDWEFYKRNVLLVTDRKRAFKNWDGACFYCKKDIRDKPKWSKFEPTVDHKKSIFYGFHNKHAYCVYRIF